MALPTARANGIDLFYADEGDPSAPPVLLIMGLATQMIAWPAAFREGLVDRGLRVISFDNRDVGRSTWLDGADRPSLLWTALRARLGLPPRTAYGLRDMAADAFGLLDSLDIAAAHVVGASMGGAIAQIMAAEHPERVLSLTSIMATSGAPGLPGPDPALRRRLMRRRPAAATREQAAALGAEIASLLAYPDPARPPGAFRQAAEAAFDRGYNPDGVRRQLLAIIADGSRAGRLARISAPTLVIHGRVDPLVPVACGADVARRVPGARLAVVDAMGHDLPPSQLPTLVELIAEHVGADPRHS